MFRSLCDDTIMEGKICLVDSDYPILYAARNLGVQSPVIPRRFPMRLYANIHWGQDKADAELDCQRRLREMG